MTLAICACYGTSTEARTGGFGFRSVALCSSRHETRPKRSEARQTPGCRLSHDMRYARKQERSRISVHISCSAPFVEDLRPRRQARQTAWLLFQRQLSCSRHSCGTVQLQCTVVDMCVMWYSVPDSRVGNAIELRASKDRIFFRWADRASDRSAGGER